MNSLCITGKLRENINELYRYFEYELPYFDEPDAGPCRIVTKFWTNQPKSLLCSLPENTRVIMHAHLDHHEKFGTILVVEQIETAHK